MWSLKDSKSNGIRRSALWRTRQQGLRAFLTGFRARPFSPVNPVIHLCYHKKALRNSGEYAARISVIGIIHTVGMNKSKKPLKYYSLRDILIFNKDQKGLISALD
jgi:hypothetical protein